VIGTLLEPAPGGLAAAAVERANEAAAEIGGRALRQAVDEIFGSDPGEPPLKGGLLIARHGRGYFVYTGLAFFRQLPAGVPGAYRLFANLISLGK